MRISVKNLALTCLSTVVQIYPHVLLKYLEKQKSTQQLSDVFLYATHPDPQLRGVVRVLIAAFIKAVLIENSGNYKDFIETHNAVNDCDFFKIEHLMGILMKVIFCNFWKTT